MFPQIQFFNDGNPVIPFGENGNFREIPESRRKKIRRNSILSGSFSIESGFRGNKIILPAAFQMTVFLSRKIVRKTGMDGNSISARFFFRM